MEPFQARLSEPERLDLQRHSRERRFARNEVVVHEGDPGDALHIVERGLFVARSSSTLGHVVTVNLFPPGAVFGEMALLLPDSVRSATIVALTDGRTRSLRRAEFEDMRSRSSGRHIEELLTADLVLRMRKQTSQLIELLFTPTTKRVQRQLLRLDELGLEGDGWIRIGQGELAMMTATTRATVNRALRDLEKAGILEVARGRVRVADRGRLADKAR